jgi:hypothetical protein
MLRKPGVFAILQIGRARAEQPCKLQSKEAKTDRCGFDNKGCGLATLHEQRPKRARGDMAYLDFTETSEWLMSPPRRNPDDMSFDEMANDEIEDEEDVDEDDEEDEEVDEDEDLDDEDELEDEDDEDFEDDEELDEEDDEDFEDDEEVDEEDEEE